MCDVFLRALQKEEEIVSDLISCGERQDRQEGAGIVGYHDDLPCAEFKDDFSVGREMNSVSEGARGCVQGSVRSFGPHESHDVLDIVFEDLFFAGEEVVFVCVCGDLVVYTEASLVVEEHGGERSVVGRSLQAGKDLGSDVGVDVAQRSEVENM